MKKERPRLIRKAVKVAYKSNKSRWTPPKFNIDEGEE